MMEEPETSKKEFRVTFPSMKTEKTRVNQEKKKVSPVITSNETPRMKIWLIQSLH